MSMGFVNRYFLSWWAVLLTSLLLPSPGIAQATDPESLELGQISQAITESRLPPLGEAIAYLPDTTELGVKLVVKLSARRVYVYQDDQVIASYPVAIGKPGWETPPGTFRVFSKEVNPIFKSFKTGTVIPPGPDNPLGVRWIGIWTDGKTQLGFHGTNEAELIGQAVSHGCIRMRNQDVVALYEQVAVGTVVVVQP